MSQDPTILSFKIEGFQKLVKALKLKNAGARIGILKDHAHKGSPNTTVATVGTAHEFGTSTIPKRSFLRTPIAENLNKKLGQAGLLTENTMKEVIRSGTVYPWLYLIAQTALECVSEAFLTSGFGSWPPRKKMGDGHPLLIETGDLMSSISAEVQKT